MIDRPHAARIARRLARHARKPDGLLDARITARLWGLLETHPAARTAYACPTDATLREHAATLTPDQLEEAAAHLEALAVTPLPTDPEAQRGATE